MSVLLNPIRICIDFRNCLCNTDEFVLRTAYHMMKDGIPLPFQLLMNDKISENDMGVLSILKEQRNPLVEFVSDKTSDGSYCDTFYDTILNSEYSQLVLASMTFSSVAHNFRPLLKDNNLEVIYIYLGYDVSLSIQNHIKNFFYNHDKVCFVIGDKYDFLKEKLCDWYMFEHASDIQLLMNNSYKNNIEILIPDFKFNTEIKSNVKTVILPNGLSLSDMRNKYHILPHIMSLPV